MTRLHLVGLPHTEFTDSRSWCAFTTLGKRFATMMTRRGHEVILYGGQENEAECSEFVTCHDAVGPDFFVPPWTQEYFQPMNERVVVEMRKRIQPGDLILLSMGVVQLPIQDAFPGNISVEYCVGYGGATAPARVFPSEAWRHVIYGHRAENVMVIRGYCTDAVIPHFLDPDQFPFGKGGDYLLFVGRLGGLKGEEIAVQTSQMTGVSNTADVASAWGRGVTAEVIAEDPANMAVNKPFTLADFGTVTFSHVTPLLQGAQAIAMVPPDGVPLAMPDDPIGSTFQVGVT